MPLVRFAPLLVLHPVKQTPGFVALELRQYLIRNPLPPRTHAAQLCQLRHVRRQLAVFGLELSHEQVVKAAIRRVCERLHRRACLPCVNHMGIPLLPFAGHQATFLAKCIIRSIRCVSVNLGTLFTGILRTFVLVRRIFVLL